MLNAPTKVCLVGAASVLGGLAARAGRGAAPAGGGPVPPWAQGRAPLLVGAGLAAVAVGSAWQRPLWSGPAAGLPAGVAGLAGVAVWACLLVAVGVADLCWMRVPPALWRAGAPAVFAGALVAAGTSGYWLAAASGAMAALVGALAYISVAALLPGRLGGADARMAALVAFGVGAVRPGLAVACLAVAPLACALWARAPRAGRGRGQAVALCPFLAVAGVVGVAVGAR